jgi:hypothetical protein
LLVVDMQVTFPGDPRWRADLAAGAKLEAQQQQQHWAASAATAMLDAWTAHAQTYSATVWLLELVLLSVCCST